MGRCLGSIYVCIYVCVLTAVTSCSRPTTTREETASIRALRLTGVIPSQGRHNYVTAVTSLGDDVFTVRWFGQLVEVYDANTGIFALQRYISVPGLFYSHGLAACAHHKCLYVSDCHQYSVHRVDLSRSNAARKWSVAKEPRGLSVNGAHNVVVACCGANRLQEYTTEGTIVRDIRLSGMTNPWHAVQLSSGHYAVSQFTGSGLVGVVAVDGQVVRSCGQSQSSDVAGKLEYPKSLAVTKNDDILVADDMHNRILSMSSSLECVRELVLPVDDGISEPEGLCLDESRGRLHVSESGGQNRLLVFDVILRSVEVC